MSSLKFVCRLLLGLCLAISVSAQDKPPLFGDIERVFREQETYWKIERLDVKGDFDPLEQNIVLRSGKRQAAIRVVIWKNVKDARDTFAGELNARNNMYKGRRHVRLPNFGDEAYIWKLPGSNAWPTIDFRKGSVNVTVFAPSAGIAKEFARRILEQIDAQQN